MENNQQIKLYPPRCGNTASFVCYFPCTQGIQHHFSVIVHTHKVMQLHLSVIFINPGEHSFIFFIIIPTSRGIQLYLLVIFHAHKGIQLHLFLIFGKKCSGIPLGIRKITNEAVFP
jgi:hypothetical protein